MLDDNEPDDPDIHRLWLIANVAKEFGLSPYAVAQELDDDPEQLSVICLQLLRYSEAHAAYRRANKDELKAWQGKRVMRMVEETDYALVQRGD